MSTLESRASVPFELGTYHFNLHWKWFQIGHATLSFCQEPLAKERWREVITSNSPEERVVLEHLGNSCTPSTSSSKWIPRNEFPMSEKDVTDPPKNTVYSGNGSLYEVVFKANVELPLVSSIVEEGTFSAIVCVNDRDAHPLVSVAETKILGYKRTLTSVYDYSNNKIIINSKEHDIDAIKMQYVRDPTSHVIHVLFRPRMGGGSYFCGYYHNMSCGLQKLMLQYTEKDNVLVGMATIPAGAYLVNTEFMLELPYSKNGDLFVPSLKERVAVSHRVLGKVVFEFERFIKNQHQ